MGQAKYSFDGRDCSTPYEVLQLIHRWLAGETVYVNGKAIIFPHGVKEFREFLEQQL